MTEAEWLTGDELWRMLRHVDRLTRWPLRKAFHYCIQACFNRGETLPGEYLPILKELEQLVDETDWGEQTMHELETFSAGDLHGPVVRIYDPLCELRAKANAIRYQRYAVYLAPGEPTPWYGDDPRFEPDEAVMFAFLANVDSVSFGDGKGSILHSGAEADLLRDIFGNPFRPVAFHSSWRTEHTVGIASKMYDEREFAAMPILADALEEAGCDNADILAHCREPGIHVRGCWVVDLVLGKA